MKKKPTLLIPIFMGMSYRNFITTNIIKDLQLDYDIEFLLLENSHLKSLLEVDKLNYNIIKQNSLKSKFFRIFINKIINKLQFYHFYQKTKVQTIRKYLIRDFKSNFINFAIIYFITKIISFFSKKEYFLGSLYRCILEKESCKIIDKYDEVLLLSTDVLYDKAILSYCSKVSKNCHVIVHSWDNLPSRGHLSAKPTSLMVWNSTMKKEAIQLHGLKDNEVCIIGVPQFNFYSEKSKDIQKKDFHNYYGLDGIRKVLTFTCSAYRSHPDEPLLIDSLIKFTKEKNLYLILRLHPTERQEEYIKKYSNISNVIIDIPKGQFAAAIMNNVDNNIEEVYKFIALMKYSDLVINFLSTIMLDAVNFDTPVIAPMFNIDETIDETYKAMNQFQITHLQTVFDIGGINLAYSEDELYILIDKIINNSFFNEKRRKIMKDIMLSPDIKPSEMIKKVLNGEG